MIKRLFLSIAISCASVQAQTAQPIIQPHQTFVDGSGNPCAGCSLYSYAAGTTTPQPTYTDASGTTQNTNPVILDAAGGANIWIGASAYKFSLLDTSGTVLWTVDQVIAPLSGRAAFLPLTGGTLTGLLKAPYFQFTSFANACGSGLFVSGWNASGWICGTPVVSGTAGGDLSGSYPNPTVAQVNGAAVPTSATLVGTDASGHIVSQTGTITNPTSGNAATATALASAPTNCGSGNTAYGISANGNALCNAASTVKQQSARAGGCTTGSSTYSTCTTTVTFPAAFADTNYDASCTGQNPSDARAAINGYSITDAQHVSVITVTEGSNAVSYGSISCVAIHN